MCLLTSLNSASALTPTPLSDVRLSTPAVVSGAPVSSDALLARAYQIANSQPGLAAALEAKPTTIEPPVDATDHAFVQAPLSVIGWLSKDNHFLVAAPMVAYTHVTARTADDSTIVITYKWAERELLNPAQGDLPKELCDDIMTRMGRASLPATMHTVAVPLPRNIRVLPRTGRDITPGRPCNWVVFSYLTDLSSTAPEDEVEHHADDEHRV